MGRRLRDPAQRLGHGTDDELVAILQKEDPLRDLVGEGDGDVGHASGLIVLEPEVLAKLFAVPPEFVLVVPKSRPALDLPDELSPLGVLPARRVKPVSGSLCEEIDLDHAGAERITGDPPAIPGSAAPRRDLAACSRPRWGGALRRRGC